MNYRSRAALWASALVLSVCVGACKQISLSEYFTERIAEKIEESGNPPAPPAKPLLSTATGSISASWTSVQGARSYQVWMSESSDSGNATLAAEPAGTSATIGGLGNGVVYYVWVKSVNLAGAGSFSEASSATPVGIPTGVAAVAKDSCIDLTWNPAPGATAYDVYAAESDNFQAADIKGQNIADTSCRIKDLNNGTQYWCWVQGKRTDGRGSVSAAGTATPVAATTLPGQPETPTLEVTAPKSLGVRWAELDGASLYGVWYGESPDQASAALWGDQYASFSTEITGLKDATRYYVWVRGWNSLGFGAWSGAATSLTLPAAPTGLSVTGTTGAVNASWTAVSSAIDYEVRYGTGDQSAEAAVWNANLTGTNASITGLADGTTYKVWVRARNAAGSGDFCEPTSAPTIPAAPGAPQLSAPSARAIGATWTAVTGAENYELWYGPTDSSAAATAWSTSLSDTNATVTGLADNTLYYFWIKAKNVSGASPMGAAGSYRTIPAVPGSPSVTGGDMQVSATWTAVAGASSYEVWYHTSDDSSAAAKWSAEPTTTSVTISGLAKGTTYYVWLKAKSASGSSAFSVSGAAVTIPPAPAAPTLTGGTGRISATWAATAGASSYEVWYGTSDASGSANLWGVKPTSPSATITGLTAYTTYYVWIKAVNAVGTSDFGAVASARTTIAAADSPSVIGGVGSVTASWSAVPDATGYQVWYADSDDSESAILWSEPSAAGSAVITGLQAGTTYYVWIRVKNGASLSDFGIPGSAITAPASPGAPTVVGGEHQAAATWTAVAGATGYEIWYNSSNNSAEATCWIVQPSSPSATVTGLAGGTTYWFWIKAKNGSGTSGFGSVGSCLTIPAAPDTPSLVGGTGQVTASWTAATGAASYSLYYGTSIEPATPGPTGITGTSATITGLLGGTTYYVRVTATNASGTSGYGSVSAGGLTIPDAPGAPTLVGGTGQVTASWSAVTGAASYSLYYGTSAAPTTPGPSGITGTSATISGLLGGTTYYVRATATNASGTSGYGSVSAGGLTIPDAPGAPNIGGGTNQISTYWSAVTGAASYSLYYGTSTSPTTLYASNLSAGTSYTISGLSSGTTYYTRVTATNASGTSGYGSVSAGGLTIPSPPDTPSIVGGTGQVTVSWSATTGAASYSLYCDTSTTPTTLWASGITGTSATVTGLSSGTTYYARLTATNATGTSGYGKVSAAGLTIPAAPTCNSLTGGSAQVTVMLNASAGAAGYTIYSNTSYTTTGAKTTTITAPSTSATITGLLTGTPYYLFGSAYNASGASSINYFGSVPTIPAAPGAPTLTVPGAQQITASWTGVNGATSYSLYYGTSTSPTTLWASGITGINATITGLTNGTTYYMRLKATNASGTSDYGTVSAGKITLPAAPGAPTLTVPAAQQITASWTGVTGATSYSLYYGTSTTPASLWASGITGINATVTGLANGTTYYMRLKATNASGTSAYGTVSAGKITIPAVPAAPGVAALSKALLVSWTLVTGASSYEVWYRVLTNDPSSGTTKAGTATTNAYTIGSLGPLKTYVWIKAVNASGTSDFSPSGSGTPLP